MNDVLKSLQDFYSANTQLVLIIVGALAGAVFTRLFPALWSFAANVASFVGRKIGGRFAYKAAQYAYLNWVVLQNQDLNLTGIVGVGDKPKLEQVFTTLRLRHDLDTQPETEIGSPKEELVDSYLGALNQIGLLLRRATTGVGVWLRAQFGVHRTSGPPEDVPLFVPRRFWKLHLIWERDDMSNVVGYLLVILLGTGIPFYGLVVKPDIENWVSGFSALISTLVILAGVIAIRESSIFDSDVDLEFIVVAFLIFVMPGYALGFAFIERALLEGQSPTVIVVGSVIGALVALWLYARGSRTSKFSVSETQAARELGDILVATDHLAILGGPGTGKSTLTQYLALTFAQEKAGDRRLRERGIVSRRLGMSNWFLPIPIPLRKISRFLLDADPKLNENLLVESFRQQVLPSDVRAVFSDDYVVHLLRNRRCLFLLDGLDEVSNEREFGAVVREITGVVSRYPGNKVVVTSRHAGWRGGVGSSFAQFEVSKLDQEQVDRFVQRWYYAIEENRAHRAGLAHVELAFGRQRAAENAQKLRTALREVESIRRLAENPLLLSIICFVHYHKTLPRERLSLYQECSNLLLVQWDQEKGLPVDDTNLTLARKEAIMKEIAFALHTGRIGATLGRKEASGAEILPIVESMLVRFHMDPALAHVLFKKLIDRSGVLVVTERYRDRYSFSHLTFQEFYAAKYLQENALDVFSFIQRESDEAFEGFTHWWREVLLLYSALLKDPSSVVSKLLDENKDDFLNRKLQIAAQCLLESIEVSDQQVENAVLSELMSIRSHGHAADRVQAKRHEVKEYLLRFATRPRFTRECIIWRSESGQREADPDVSQLFAHLEDLALHSDSEARLVSLDAIIDLASKNAQHSHILDRRIYDHAVTSGDPDVQLTGILALLLCPPKPLAKELLDDVLTKTIGIARSRLYGRVDIFCKVLNALRVIVQDSAIPPLRVALVTVMRRALSGEVAYNWTGQTLASFRHLERMDDNAYNCVWEALLRFDDSTQRDSHMRQLCAAATMGPADQQARAIHLLALGFPSQSEATEVIIGRLQSPIGEVRLAALAALRDLRLDMACTDRTIAILRSTESRRSRIGVMRCRLEQALLGKGAVGQDDIERIRALETLLMLSDVSNQAARDILFQLYWDLGARKRWEVLSESPRDLFRVFNESNIEQIISWHEQDKASFENGQLPRRQWQSCQESALSLFGGLKVNCTEGEKAKLVQIAVQGIQADGRLKTKALAVLRGLGYKLEDGSHEHEVLLMLLGDDGGATADSAFDLLVENGLL